MPGNRSGPRISPARRLSNSPSVIVLARILSAFLSLLSAPIVARALGPEGRGETAAALAVTGLAPLLVGWGVPLVVRRLSVDRSRISPAIRGVRIVALWALLPSAVIAGGCRYLLLPTVDNATGIVFIVAVASAPLSVVWICTANVLVAQRRHGAFALINLLPAAISVGALIVGWQWGWITVGYVLLANLFGNVGTFVTVLFLVPVTVRGPRVRARSLLRDGMSFGGSQVAEAASYRLDQAIALPLMGGAQAGLYSVAATVALLPYAVGQAVGTAIFGNIAEDVTAEVRQERIAQAVRAALLIAGLTAVVLAIVTPFAVPLVFGRNFAGAVGPTIVGLIGSIAVVLSYVASSALVALGRGSAILFAQLLGLAIGICALAILGTLWGALGASIASSMGFWSCALYAIVSLRLPVALLVPRRSDFYSAARMLLRG
ncbi:hypothetical protein E3O44_13625 [Cryobacterium algoricola]|uniref:Polysaccharide biosynthesis protein C-terminal domain-containing protein n=1 Tax=Cryobacterium algoricola TaxID=1259183 RepID=A0ABY2IDF2_9MICO|nr:oligosaccharide flippase family protein [Cryobacterium algoricola]TFB85620.1 hypothetical protein E3O44_13625 [Cryobacterium algoricola]